MIIVDGKLDLCPCSRKHWILVNNVYTICPKPSIDGSWGDYPEHVLCPVFNPCIFSAKADDFYCQPFGQAPVLPNPTLNSTSLCYITSSTTVKGSSTHANPSLKLCGIFHLKLVFVCAPSYILCVHMYYCCMPFPHHYACVVSQRDAYGPCKNDYCTTVKPNP